LVLIGFAAVLAVELALEAMRQPLFWLAIGVVAFGGHSFFRWRKQPLSRSVSKGMLLAAGGAFLIFVILGVWNVVNFRG
jgi:hypothetical protein